MERERVVGLEPGTTEQAEEDAAAAYEQNVKPDEALLDSIWIELDGVIGRERIQSAIGRARAKYADARVKIFVPILVRRHILDELRAEE